MPSPRFWAAVFLAAACLLLLSGCPEAREERQPPAAARSAGAPAPAPAVDPDSFRALEAAEREGLDNMSKERCEAQAEQAAAEALSRAALSAPGRPAARAAQTPDRSGSWTIAMAPSPYAAGTLDRAQDQFEHFTGLWLERLGRNLRSSQDHADVQPDAGPEAGPDAGPHGQGWVASFICLDKDSCQLEVKPTDQAACPFVGVLRYLEHHYEARGATPGSVAQGPFRLVKSVRVTEIFSYSGDAWVH